MKDETVNITFPLHCSNLFSFTNSVFADRCQIKKRIMSAKWGCNYPDLLSSCSGRSLARWHGATVMALQSFSPSPQQRWEFESNKESRGIDWLPDELFFLFFLSWISSLQPSRVPVRGRKWFPPIFATLIYKCVQFCVISFGESGVIKWEQWEIRLCFGAFLFKYNTYLSEWNADSYCTVCWCHSPSNNGTKDLRSSPLLDSLICYLELTLLEYNSYTSQIFFYQCPHCGCPFFKGCYLIWIVEWN